jgi:pilus assembly protein FimV
VVTIVKKSKVRLLTKTLAVVSLLAPASGHPLGIGEIKLHSALNQNLNAEISLTLSGENVSDIKVNLAPPEKFDEAGVSWTYFLSKIKFETIAQSNGAAVIKLTSKEALKEPFLDFLLEVSWPKGSLYREFTVLVDPPSVYNQATIPVSTSTESYVQPPAVKPQAHANGQSAEGQYGPTLENDTLWSVAERVRGQGDISVEQMMIALYEANPQAFYKGNVYALMAGTTLKIPGREAVLKLSRNQALAEFNRHKKAWKNHSAPANAEAVKEKPVLGKAEGPADNQLTLAAPTKAAVTDKAVVTSEQVVAEKKAAGVATDAAMQSKVAELEKQLAMMQELIALKDQQLAALQNQSPAKPAGQDQAATSEVAAAKPADQTAPIPQQAADQPIEEAKPAQSAEPGQAVQPVEAVPPVQPAQPAQQAEAAKPAEAAQPAPPPVKPPQPVQPVAQQEPEVGSLLNPYYLGGGGAVILTLLGWLWWRKRKVDEETNTESMFASTSMLEEAAAENISVPVVEDSATAHEHDAGTVGESSFLSEFTPSDFDSFDTDQGEIDPISEADVYLAYGRYQQAEELIRQAIIDQPNRDECKLKLLEVFYANENQAAFEAYANELARAGKRNEAEFWEKAAEMGREICPDSPLFSSGNDLFPVADNSPDENSDEGVVAVDAGFNKDAGAASFSGAVSDGFDKEPADKVFDVDVTSLEAKDDYFVDQPRNNEDIDFDLGPFAMDAGDADKGVIASSMKVAGDSKVPVPVESVDFDLSSFSMDTAEADEAEKGVIASSTQVESIDFDLDSFSMEEANKDVIASGTQADEQVESIDFDLSSFSMDSEEAEQGVITPSTFASKPAAQADYLDFDLSSFSMESEDSDKGVIAPNTSESKASGVQTGDFDSFSMDTGESDKAENEFAAPSTLSELHSDAQVANNALDFESLEFDFGSNDDEIKELDNLDFSESGDEKSSRDAGFSEDQSLTFNDDLSSDFDFDFDLDMSSTTSGQDFSQHDAFGVSDLTDMDELETKLDLAKAYVDMGDADAAKDIAREVLEQGTAEQKKIAQALLDELS